MCGNRRSCACVAGPIFVCAIQSSLWGLLVRIRNHNQRRIQVGNSPGWQISRGRLIFSFLSHISIHLFPTILILYVSILFAAIIFNTISLCLAKNTLAVLNIKSDLTLTVSYHDYIIKA